MIMEIKTQFVYVLQRKDREGIFIFEDLKFFYEPFYVGKGSKREINGKVKYDRILHTTKNSNDHKLNLINKIDGNLEISLFFFDTEDEAYEKETEFIKKIGRKDKNLGTLVNWCDGGKMNIDPKSHFKKTAKYDLSGKLLEIFDSQDLAIEKTKITNISRACSLKIIAGNFFWRTYGKNQKILEEIETSEYLNNRIHNGNVPRKVKVIKADELIFFNSIKEASSFTGVRSPTICRSCKNQKLYNGFKFEYV